MIDFKKAPLHPTNEELADFIDNRVIGTRKQEIEEHLLFCDDCMEVVAEVKRVSKDNKDINSPQVTNVDNQEITPQDGGAVGLGYANNWLYNGRVRAMVLSGLVASVVLFLVMPTKETTPPFIAFCTSTNQCSPAFKAFDIAEDSSVVDINKTNQEINTILRELVKSTDMSYLKEFNVAEEKLKQKRFDEARELYQKAMNIVDNDMPNLDKKEKSRELIVITYKILLLGMAEGDKESVNDYKDVLLDKVRSFKRRWLLDEKN